MTWLEKAMLQVRRFVWTKQTHWRWFKARSLSQSNVIARTLLVTSDDVIWPEMHVLEVTGLNFCLNLQKWAIKHVCDCIDEKTGKQVQSEFLSLSYNREVPILTWPSWISLITDIKNLRYKLCMYYHSDHPLRVWNRSFERSCPGTSLNVLEDKFT